jgi:hypothetical protein
MTQILPRFYRTQEAADDHAKITRNLIESGEMAPDTLTSAGATAAGDERRLRGVPVQARGVGGTVLGTHPLAALMAKQPRDD